MMQQEGCEGDFVKECRNCHEMGGELISPCQCTGSIRWVHRSCLDTWRAVSPNPASFTVCDLCRTPYRMRRRPITSRRKALVGFKIARDIFFVLLGVVALIAVFGLAAWGIDAGTGFTEGVLPASWQHFAARPVFQVFVYGPALLCFVLGIVGICFGFCKLIGACDSCCGAPTYTYDTYGYHSCFPPWWWWWCMWSPPHSHTTCDCDCGDCCSGGDCDCGNCSGGGSSSSDDCGKAALILVVVVVVIIIIVGLFVGVGLLCVVVYKLITNHIHVLNREKDALGLEVVDTSKFPDRSDDEVVVEMSAPPLHDDPDYEVGKPLMD